MLGLVAMTEKWRVRRLGLVVLWVVGWNRPVFERRGVPSEFGNYPS